MRKVTRKHVQQTVELKDRRGAVPNIQVFIVSILPGYNGPKDTMILCQDAPFAEAYMIRHSRWEVVGIVNVAVQRG